MPASPLEEGATPTPLARRLAWFLGIAIVSGATVAAIAYALRGILFLGS